MLSVIFDYLFFSQILIHGHVIHEIHFSLGVHQIAFNFNLC